MRLLIARTARDDDGMSTAEYAVGTVAACGFAGLRSSADDSAGARVLTESSPGAKLPLGLVDSCRRRDDVSPARRRRREGRASRIVTARKRSGCRRSP